MPRPSPLRNLLEDWAASLSTSQSTSQAHRPGAAVGEREAGMIDYLPWGDAVEGGEPPCEIVASFGQVQAEYAALRRGAGLVDLPNRGTIVVTGSFNDRRDYLNRMLTQELKDLALGMVKESFWLNRKGRIDADLLVVELGDRMLLDVDIHQVGATVKSLAEFIFAEDVDIKDASAQFHRLAMHGPHAPQALARAMDAHSVALDNASALTNPQEFPPGQARTVSIAGVPVVVARRDQVGEPGLELFVPLDQVTRVWQAILYASSAAPVDRQRIRPVGWHAFNAARIEAGTPLFNIDFGTTNLPHEAGILKQRVSFTKGCYLGQEIVARMESLGKPKRTLVGLRVLGDHLPVAGGQVFAKNADPHAASPMGEEIGVVTSSTLSPMLGAASIAFATIKTAHAVEGATVLVNAEGEQATAAVSPLRFWPSPEPSASTP